MIQYDKEGKVRYQCSGCGAVGVKLWRDYQMFLDHQTLYCVACAEKDQGKPCKLSAPDGEATDQIGWLVPAVPTAEGDTFWGYTSVPADRAQWWRDLPLRSERMFDGGRDAAP